MNDRRRWLIAFVVALFGAGVTGVVIGILDDESGTPGPPDRDPGIDLRTGKRLPEAPLASEFGDQRPRLHAADPDAEREENVEEGPSGPAPRRPDEVRAAGAVHSLLAALDDHGAARVCAAFEPGALDDFPFPRRRGGCRASVSASLGYRDPRGLPVWRNSKPTESISASVDGASARVVATIVTHFAAGREPSIEDDIIYLHRSGRRWLIVKPSSTIYRAMGVADVPPAVISPPR